MGIERVKFSNDTVIEGSICAFELPELPGPVSNLDIAVQRPIVVSACSAEPTNAD